MEKFSAVRAVKAAAWIAIATVALALLCAFDVVAIGVRGQWTFGVYPEPIRPNYENLWVPILGATLIASALAAAWKRLEVPRPRWERAAYVTLVMLGGLVHLVGSILISRAGMKEPAMVARIDWAGGYFNDALRLKDEPDVMRRYSELRPRLSLHGRAHPPGPVLINMSAMGCFRKHPGFLRVARAVGADISELPLPSHPESATWMQEPPPVKDDSEWAALVGVAWFVVALAILPAIFIYQIG